MRKSVVLATATALAVGACSDGTGPNAGAMSRTEALGVAAFVATSTEGAAGTSMSQTGPDMQNPPVSFTHTHESSHPCPSGGSVAVAFTLSGTVDQETQSLVADLEGSHTHTGCAFPHNGLTITIDANPAVDFAASLATANGQPSEPFTHTVEGSFNWNASDGRSGSCSITYSAVTDFLQRSRTVEGSVCGHTFTQTTTWS